jgi:hypothetical protein
VPTFKTPDNRLRAFAVASLLSITMSTRFYNAAIVNDCGSFKQFTLSAALPNQFGAKV